MISKNQKKQNKAQKERRSVNRSSEAYLWVLLHNKRLKGNRFFRHYRVGDFYVDFFCPDISMAIIIDSHVPYTGFSSESCCERERYLESIGVNVLHIDSNSIMKSSKTILDKIVTEVSAAAICESLKIKVDRLEALSLN